MAHITNIAAVENKTAIWEFNPALKKNHIANRGLDVIAALCTLAIKVSFLFSIHLSGLTLIQHQIQASGVRIEYFNELQIQCSIGIPLKIPLHSNIRWGTAHTMLDRANKLQQVRYSTPLSRASTDAVQAITLFIRSADRHFGPITTIHREGEATIHIPCMAFTFSEADWKRVVDAQDIVTVRFSLHSLTSADWSLLGLESNTAMFLVLRLGRDVHPTWVMSTSV
jgi:hypothetical protein